MIEFAVFSAALTVLLVTASRKGTEHLAGKRLLAVLMTVGWLAGISIYAMPTADVSSGLDSGAILAGLIGLFIGRLFARIAQAWYLAHRGWEEKDPEAPPRLLHPWIAVGLFLTGIPVLYGWTAARHEALEYANAARHPADTPNAGILRGGEALALEPDAPSDHAVLLLHGYLANPSIFGDLPEALRDAGLAVHAPLLPGHGTRPDDLIGVTYGDWLDATAVAWDELEERYEKVSIVGFSLGATLAVLESQGRAPHRMVFANPYLGHIQTPPWLPFEVDSVIPVVARLTPRVFRSDAYVRLAKRENLDRLVSYRTVSLANVVELQKLGKRIVDFDVADLTAPVLVLSSDGDQTTPVSTLTDWCDALAATGGGHERIGFARSDHLLFLDHEADDAIERAVDWIIGKEGGNEAVPGEDE